jgi:hypothetical protein
MSDDAAKKGLGISIVAGAALGVPWALSLDYGLIEVRAWNVVGLAVITTVSVFAVIAALRGFAAVRAAERRHGGAPPPP